MVQAMFKHTISASFYISVAALIIGLAVSGLLAPITIHRVQGREMQVFAVLITYDPPPPTPPATPAPSAPPSPTSSYSDSLSSMSSTSFSEDPHTPSQSLSTSSFSSPSFSGSTLQLAPTRASSAASASENVPSTSTPASSSSSSLSLSFVAESAQSAIAQEEPPKPDATSDGSLAQARRFAPNAVDAAASTVSSPSSFSNDGRNESDDSGNMSSSDSDEPGEDQTRRVVYINALPHGRLRSLMILFLVFDCLSVLLSLSLMCASIGQLVLQIHMWKHMVNAMRFTLLADVCCVLVYFAAGIAIVVQTAPYEPIAGGYYASRGQARSAFSCAVVATGIALFAVIAIPVMRAT